MSKKQIRPTETALEKFWWWRANNTWHRIAKIVYGEEGNVLAGVAFAEYGPAAMFYEASARRVGNSKHWPPRWKEHVPFNELDGCQMRKLVSKLPKSNRYAQSPGFGTWANLTDPKVKELAIKLDDFPKASDDEIYIHLSVRPAETSSATFFSSLQEQVQFQMASRGLSWGFAKASAGVNRKPLPWKAIEDADRWVNNFDLGRNEESRKKHARLTLARYAKRKLLV